MARKSRCIGIDAGGRPVPRAGYNVWRAGVGPGHTRKPPALNVTIIANVGYQESDLAGARA
jgi:hypothetical protein